MSDTPPSLRLENVSRRYGRKQVLESVSHTFPRGLTLLTGPSGAGKSTLLRLCATAEKPTSGALFWEGKALPGARIRLRRALGYAPQAVDLPEDLTAREFGLHMAALKGLNAGQADAQFRMLPDALNLGPAANRRIPSFPGVLPGLKSADPDLERLFDLYGASPVQRLIRLRLPAALPFVLEGLRVAAGLAVIGAVVAEFVSGSGATQGLAWRLLEAGNRLRTADMLAALACLMAMGLALNLVVSVLERAVRRRLS